MRLLLPSAIISLYIVASLIAFAPWRLSVKLIAGGVVFLICLKYSFYEWIGGSFIAPDLPFIVQLMMEALYASMVILFVLLLIKDSLALLLWLARLAGFSWQLPFSAGVRSAGLVITALVLGIFGTWQSVRVPVVRTVELALPEIPAHLDGFSIVQISDIHIGPLLKKNWLKRVVERTNALTPDLIALTGDMIDDSPENIKDEIAPLGELSARYGVYGVTGNHEYYFRADRWLPVFEKLGIRMLSNEHRTLSVGKDADLVVAGVTDKAGQRYGGPGPDRHKALKDAPDVFRILLSHRPSGASGQPKADLQLSGHTHGGNMFFFKWLISTYNGGWVGGLYDVEGMKLYVSPGTGLWAGFSCRLGVPSEITRIVLRARETGIAAIP